MQTDRTAAANYLGITGEGGLMSQATANIRKKEHEDLEKHQRLKEERKPKRRRDPGLNPQAGGEPGLEGEVREQPIHSSQQ